MVKLTIKIDNHTYNVLEQMSKDSGINIQELIKLFIINKTSDYMDHENLV